MQNITIEMELGEYGEGLPCSSDILSLLFGNQAASNIEEIILESEDAEYAFEQLRELKIFHRFDDESIQRLICIFLYDYCVEITIRLSLNNQGILSISFFS